MIFSVSRSVVIGTVLTLALSGSLAHADTLQEVKASLARLIAPASAKAVVEIKNWHKQGEGKEGIETQGLLSLTLEDTSRGLQILYGRELMARVDVEQRARVTDPNVKMPLGTMLHEVDPVELRHMMSAAPGLLRTIERAIFKEEKPDTYQGKPARLLHFELSLDKLSDRDRKYVKHFDGYFDLWVNSDNVPLASRGHHLATGRAFIVVSFSAQEDELIDYAVSDQRLMVLRKETSNTASGAGEKDERKVVKTLRQMPMRE